MRNSPLDVKLPDPRTTSVSRNRNSSMCSSPVITVSRDLRVGIEERAPHWVTSFPFSRHLGVGKNSQRMCRNAGNLHSAFTASWERPPSQMRSQVNLGRTRTKRLQKKKNEPKKEGEKRKRNTANYTEARLEKCITQAFQAWQKKSPKEKLDENTKQLREALLRPLPSDESDVAQQSISRQPNKKKKPAHNG